MKIRDGHATSTLPLGTPAAATVTIREPATADEMIAIPNGMTLFEFVKSLIAERDTARAELVMAKNDLRFSQQQEDLHRDEVLKKEGK